MAGLNLLPWRAKEREQKKKQFFAMVGGVAIASVIGVFGWHLYMQHLVATQIERNQTLEQEITFLDKRIEEIKNLEGMRTALLERMKIIENLQSTRPSIVHLFDEMVNALPKGLYLVHLQQEGTALHLQGKAESYARVSSYMNRLDASSWFSSSNLNVISNSNGGKDGQLQLRDFKLDVNQLLTEGNDEANKDGTNKNKVAQGAKK